MSNTIALKKKKRIYKDFSGAMFLYLDQIKKEDRYEKLMLLDRLSCYSVNHFRML